MKNSKKSRWYRALLLCLSLVVVLTVAVAAEETAEVDSMAETAEAGLVAESDLVTESSSAAEFGLVAEAASAATVEQKILCVEQGSFCPLTPAETKTMSIGSKIMEPVPEVTGYRAVSTFGWCRISKVDVTLADGYLVGSVPADDYRLVVLYERRTDLKEVTLRINYHVDGVIYNTLTETLWSGEHYRVEVPVKVGHSTFILPGSDEAREGDVAIIEGDMPETDVSYDVDYVPNYYNVVLDYYRPGDSEPWASDVFPFRYGESYFIADFGRDGYSAQPSSVSGLLNVTQDVHHRIDLVPLEYTLTIEHCYGNVEIGEVFDTTTYRIAYGTAYSIPTHAYGDWQPSASMVTGVMPNHDTTVRVAYDAGPGDFEPSPERPA